MITSDAIFDTRIDTNKIYVSMKTKFVIRNYKNSEKKSPLYLHITGNSKRERINLDILVDPTQWDKKYQRLKPLSPRNVDTNLILENINSKITNIKTVYRLSELVLTPAILKREMIDDLPRVNFCAFFQKTLTSQKYTITPGTFRRYQSVLNKLKDYQDEIIFTEINIDWFTKYRNHLASLKNKQTTINSNIIAIKKYLRIAQKSGIKFPCNLEDVVGGSTQGNKISLTPSELQRIWKFYTSDYIIDSHKLIIGYFLFACVTGLRFQDVMNLNRPHPSQDYIEFKTKKTNKDQIIYLNEKAKQIIAICKEMFIKKLSNQHMNRELKIILKTLGITKKVSFHIARHTFATSFLRMGGRVEKLQILLGHSDIKQTMIYVHIVAAEANESIHLLDDLF